MVLSAELPITQAEVEFLREVRVYVPRIFYVLNKVDLLTGEELEQTSAFIKDAIIRNFGYTPDLKLMPVSARIAQTAHRQAENDKAWRAGGMEAIRAAMTRFLAADKYFALARALNRKFSEALAHIRSALDKELAELRAPLQQMHGRIAVVKEHGEALRAGMAEDLSCLKDECAALRACVDAAIAGERTQARQGAERLVREIAGQERGSAHFGRRIEAVLGGFYAQVERGMAAQVTLAASGPLREAVARHRGTVERIAVSITGVLRDASAASKTGPGELSLPGTAARETALIDVGDIRVPLMTRFMPAPQRTEMLVAQALPHVLTAVDERLGRSSETLQNRIDEAWAAFSRDLAQTFRDLTAALDANEAALSAELQAAEKRARPELRRLDALAEGFAAIAAEVRD